MYYPVLFLTRISTKISKTRCFSGLICGV